MGTKNQPKSSARSDRTESTRNVTVKAVDRGSVGVRFWSRLKKKAGTYLVFLLFGSPVLLLASPIIFIPCYRASQGSVSFTVDRRERVVSGSGDGIRAYYLVWSREGEVFCVSDSWSYLLFNASDRYGKLREGSYVQVQVAGWRIPFLSWYRNVIAIDTISALE